MKREVAIKVLTSNTMNDEDAIARFYQEVEVASTLEHRNIVRANDAGQSKDVHYLVMEYVRGNDLQQIVRENGPFAVGQAVNCILQAAQGLAHAHKQRVIHRDIKPANLLLNNEGLIKILDMGLARINNPLGDSDGTRPNLTLPGSIMGTVDFMAPEQAADTSKADARSDIYSLGCTLYYILTGHPVYDGSTAMVKLIAHREMPVPSLCEIRADVSPELNAVFQHMLAKRPEDRYQSMLEVITALEPCRTETEAKTRETVTQFLSPEIRGILEDIHNTHVGKKSDTDVQNNSSPAVESKSPENRLPKPPSSADQIAKELLGEDSDEVEPAAPSPPKPVPGAQTPALEKQPSPTPPQIYQPQTASGQIFLWLVALIVVVGAGSAIWFLETPEMLLSLFGLAALVLLLLMFRPESKSPLAMPAPSRPNEGHSRSTSTPRRPPEIPAAVDAVEPASNDHMDESEPTIEAKLLFGHGLEHQGVLETYEVDMDEMVGGSASGSHEVSSLSSNSITRKRLSESNPSKIPRPLRSPFRPTRRRQATETLGRFFGDSRRGRQLGWVANAVDSHGRVFDGFPRRGTGACSRRKTAFRQVVPPVFSRFPSRDRGAILEVRR